MNQRGIIHLLPLLLIVLLIVGGLFAVSQGLIKIPSELPFSLPTSEKQLTKVEIKTEYQNPFEKKTQFVNPFDTYKNPFVVNR